jgi:hypothetical protein
MTADSAGPLRIYIGGGCQIRYTFSMHQERAVRPALRMGRLQYSGCNRRNDLFRFIGLNIDIDKQLTQKQKTSKSFINQHCILAGPS